MLGDVQLVLDELVAQPLLFVTRHALKAGNTVEHIAREMEPVDLVQHRHVKRSGGSSLFFVTTDGGVVVVGTTVCHPVNEPWIPVKGKHDRFIGGEDAVEIPI